MYDFPAPILAYIYRLALENRSPAYLLSGKDGCLLDWGGYLDFYGISNLQKGICIGEKIFFLEGFLPLQGSDLFLPSLKTDSNISIDIHIFAGEGGDWVVLLDASADEIQRTLIQQKTNDLSLLRDKESKILNRYLERDIPENLSQELFTFREEGERKEVAILFASIRKFIAYSEENSPQIVFKTLSFYLRAITQPILDEAGIIDKLVGDTIIAVFGALPSVSSPSDHAVKAALRMLDAVSDVNTTRRSDNLPIFDVGIGIASGSVILGVIENRNHRSFGVIGPGVNLAAHLENHACSKEILIDENSLRKLSRDQEYFSPKTLSLQGFTESVKVFSWSVGTKHSSMNR